MYEYPGSCHCGGIQYRFRSPQALAHFRLRECGCGYCVRFRGIYASDPGGELTLRISRAIIPYQQGTGTAQFYVCAVCGIMPVVISRIQGRDYAVINVRCSDPFAPWLGGARAMDYAGETIEERLSRRARSWIPAVTISKG